MKTIKLVLAAVVAAFSLGSATAQTMYVVHSVNDTVKANTTWTYSYNTVTEYPVAKVDSVVYAEFKIGFCPDNHHPHAIDLGDAGKWACCNVGASSPGQYGNYYSWGATYLKDTYTDDNTPTYGQSNLSDWQGKVTNNASAGNDVATALWGSKWMTPNKTQMDSLISKCTWEYKNAQDTDNPYGVAGMKVTGNGNSIFLPAAGYRLDANAYGQGSDGYYWSSSPAESDAYRAYSLGFYSSGGKYVFSKYRKYGFSVRPVCP